MIKRQKPLGWLLCCGLTALAFAGCKSPYYADKGAALGAGVGAVAGALVGEHNGNAGAGAVIGAAAGALTGVAIGDHIDQDIARNNMIIEQRIGRRLEGAVTMADVISMSQSGLGDSVIITHIRANGVAQRPTTNDLIVMKQQGVTDAVINAMQNPPVPVAAAPPRRPVVVEEHYYVRPGCYSPYWHPYDHYHEYPRPGYRVGFSVHSH